MCGVAADASLAAFRAERLRAAVRVGSLGLDAARAAVSVTGSQTSYVTRSFQCPLSR